MSDLGTTSFVEQIAKTRRQDSRDTATAEALRDRATERRRRELERSRNRELWIHHYMNLAESHALRSADFQRRAKALQEEE